MSASNLTEGQRERLRNTREEVSEDVIEDIKSTSIFKLLNRKRNITQA
jgi:hypothetical protein